MSPRMMYKLLERLPSELEEFLPTSEEIAERLSVFNKKGLNDNA